MIPRSTPTPSAEVTIDRRIWPIIAMICLFGWLVIKEVSLPSSLLAVFAGIGLLAMMVVGLQSPEIPLYVLIAYLPFSRVLVGDFGTQATAFNLTNVISLWVLVAYCLKQNTRGRSLFQGTPLNRMILLFAGLGAVSLLRAGWTYGSWYLLELITPLKRWLTPIFFYFLTLWVVRERSVLKTVVILIMVTVAVVGAMATWDYMQVGEGTSLEHARIGGIAENPNTLGAFFNYYMFLLLGFFLVYPKMDLRRWLILVPFVICFRGIMVTFSRGAYLAFATGSLAACFFHRKLLFGVAAAGLVFLALNPWFLPPGIQYRLGMTVVERPVSLEQDVTETLEASAATRIEIWRGAVKMIRDYPLWGVGYGAFPAYIGGYTGGKAIQRDAHNSYLLIAAEMGLPTLLVFLLVLAMVAHYTRWLYRHTADRFLKATALGFLAGLYALVVANMFGSRMDAQEVTGYFWMLAGVVMRAVLLEKQGHGTRDTGHGRRRLA